MKRLAQISALLMVLALCNTGNLFAQSQAQSGQSMEQRIVLPAHYQPEASWLQGWQYCMGIQSNPIWFLEQASLGEAEGLFRNEKTGGLILLVALDEKTMKEELKDLDFTQSGGDGTLLWSDQEVRETAPGMWSALFRGTITGREVVVRYDLIERQNGALMLTQILPGANPSIAQLTEAEAIAMDIPALQMDFIAAIGNP
ncbi:MAG: hypothetical protein H6581_15395 [Bacteroidia bacterium]|nr:hypothetical protein [Bacteroidia bacterium]